MAAQSKKPVSKLLVTQSNNLIEADYSKADISANPLKLFKLAIAKLNPNDKDLRLIRIKLSSYKQYMGYKPNATYGRLNQDLQSYCLVLNSQVISITLDDGGVLNAFAISSWQIDYKNDELILEVSGRLKPFLLQLRNNYTSYHLSNIPRLRSTYSIRLYELLYQYRRIGKRIFEVDELKKKIGCSYPEYGIFKRRVLLKSQADLKKQTDLFFEFEELKTGRKITSLAFYIYPNDPEYNNPQKTFAFLDDDLSQDDAISFPDEVLEVFKSIGLSKSNLDKMIAQGFGIIESETAREPAQKRCRTIDRYYIEKLTLLQQSKSKDNPAGFFIKAVKQDWTNPSLFKNQSAASRKKQAAADKKRLKSLEALREKKVKILDDKRRKIAFDFLHGKASLISELIEEVIPVGHITRQYIKADSTPEENYTGSMMVRVMVNAALAEREPDLFKQLIELEKEVEAIKSEIHQLKTA